MSSCKMGKQNEEDACVDKRLRVIGVKGLRVADASILASASGNTQVPSGMIGSRAAEIIIEDEQKKRDSSEDDDY